MAALPDAFGYPCDSGVCVWQGQKKERCTVTKGAPFLDVTDVTKPGESRLESKAFSSRHASFQFLQHHPRGSNSRGSRGKRGQSSCNQIRINETGQSHP